MNISETRLLPSPRLSSDYAFVSMPSTAWYWLDDLVSRDYPGGYKALIRDFQTARSPADLSSALRVRAQEHCERQMATLYHLANDNEVPSNVGLKPNPAHPRQPDFTLRMPSMYQLFHFLPHATYLTTIWERRNYHLKNTLV